MSSLRRRPPIIQHLRLVELTRLYRHRDGYNELEILAAIERDFGGRDPTPLNAREAGECCGLTTEERDDLGIRTIRAADMTNAEAKAHYRARRRARDRIYTRIRRQRQRQRQRPVPDSAASKIDQRTEVVCALLRQQSKRDPMYWSMVPDIIATVKASPAFAGLKDRTVRSRVHEILDRLAAAGDIGTDTAWTDVREVRVVRWGCPSPHREDASCEPTYILPPRQCPET